MFHFFHDNKKHLKAQGSISKKQFLRVISKIGRRNILDPEEFYIRYKKKTLRKNNVCLTFDDCLKSQYDIALPILQKKKIKAFFFIYSSTLTNKPDLFELYRYFRINYFKNIDVFYNEFFSFIEQKKLKKFFFNQKKKINLWKENYKYYSLNDIKFRIIRDDYLTDDQYKNIMLKLFKKYNFNYKKMIKKIFLSKNNINKLSSLGHEIGLHFHDHPTTLSKLNYKDQFEGYKKNKQILEKITNKKIFSMSHPSGSYNSNTLKILQTLKIKIGFKDNLLYNKKINISKFEIAREDVSLILNK